MINTPDLQEKWGELKVGSMPESGFVKIRLTGADRVPIYAGIRIIGELPALLVEVPSQAIKGSMKYPCSRGFVFEPIGGKQGRFGTTWLVLSASEREYSDIFSVLAQDCLDSLLSTVRSEDAIDILFYRLTRWQEFLERYGPEGLSAKQQQGLFGELYFLDKYLIPNLGPFSAVQIWTGGSGASQDFSTAKVAIEVKTTVQKVHKKFRVSGARQLDESFWERLFLFVVRFELRKVCGENSLPVLVASIFSKLENDSSACVLFRERLQEAGYLEAHRDRYLGTEYISCNESFFQVTEGFPRIREAELKPGITEVSYAVEISACQNYEVDFELLLQSVKE